MISRVRGELRDSRLLLWWAQLPLGSGWGFQTACALRLWRDWGLVVAVGSAWHEGLGWGHGNSC